MRDRTEVRVGSHCYCHHEFMVRSPTLAPGMYGEGSSVQEALLRSQVAIQSRCFMIITSCCIRAERTITSVQIDYTIIGRYDDHRFTRGRNDLVAAGRRCFHDTSPPAAGIHQAVFVRIVTVFNAIVVIENAIYQVQRAHLGRDCTF